MGDRQQSHADKVLAAFQQDANKQGKPHYFENLKRVLDGSPVLQAQFDKITSGGSPALKTIRLEKNCELEGGRALYNDNHVVIGSDSLSYRMAHGATRDQMREDVKLAFALGHEFRHAQDNNQRNISTSGIQEKIDKLFKVSDVRDYTPMVSKFINDERNHEASGQIAGWNAAMSYARHKDQTTTPLQVANILGLDNPKIISHAESVFDKNTKQPWPDLKLEANGNISLSNPKNVEAMAKHFYDQPAERVRLGNAGTDYRNASVVGLIKYIGDEENNNNKPQPGHYARIDLTALGLRRDDIQRGDLSNMRNPHFQLVDRSEANALKTVHFYPAREVAEGQFKVTKGLPGESQQELETDTPPIRPRKPEVEPQGCKSSVDQSEGARTSSINGTTPVKADGLAVSASSNVRPVYGSDLYQSLIGDMLNVSQQTKTPQQDPSQG